MSTALSRRLTAALVGLVLTAAPVAAHAATDPDNPQCQVTLTETVPGTPYQGLDLATTLGCTPDEPVVTVAMWEATTADGNPLTDQLLAVTPYDGPAPVYPTVAHLLIGAPSDCYAQVDFAFGDTPATLATPYGDRLIQAWHTGVRDCISPPFPTTPAPTPAATTEAPQPTADVTDSAPPAAPVTTTAVTTPALATPDASAGVTTPATTRPPAPVRHHPKPHRPTPKHARPAVTPPPAPAVQPTARPAVLPYTGQQTDAELIAAALALTTGAALTLIARRYSRKARS